MTISERFRGKADGPDLEARVEELAGEVDRLHRQLKQAQKTVRALKDSVQPLARAHNLRELDHGRAMQQLAVLEERVARMEERLDDAEAGPFDADDAARAEARSLVDTVRREHDQVRVRMQVVSSYEERLRRLEASVSDLYDGDERHPI